MGKAKFQMVAVAKGGGMLFAPLVQGFAGFGIAKLDELTLVTEVPNLGSDGSGWYELGCAGVAREEMGRGGVGRAGLGRDWMGVGGRGWGGRGCISGWGGGGDNVDHCVVCLGSFYFCDNSCFCHMWKAACGEADTKAPGWHLPPPRPGTTCTTTMTLMGDGAVY